MEPIIEAGALELAGEETAAQPKRQSATKGYFAEALESLLVTILFALFGTTFIVQAFKIPSGSMEPTLQVGDHLLVNKFIFGGHGAWYEKILPYRAIRRGDVIIFKFPYDDHPDYVKRAIGLPGDRVRIVDDQVFVNGSPLVEPYAQHDSLATDFLAANFPPPVADVQNVGLRPEWAKLISRYVKDGELLVPPHSYFVLGDNREDSLDSRYWGFVDRDAVIGRPVVIYWSVQAMTDDYADRSVSGSVTGIFDTLMHLPSQTRWGRLLREVH